MKVFLIKKAKKSLKWALLSVFPYFTFYLVAGQSSLPVIPKPAFEKAFAGCYKVTAKTAIYCEGLWSEGQFLAQQLFTTWHTKVGLDTLHRVERAGIALRIIRPDSLLDHEWYHLVVSAKGIKITAVSHEGVFRALQTLLQLVKEKNGHIEIPCVEVKDQPRYKWRGMHLDVCRHFFTTAEVKKYIDYLALYKFNVFHWHLTEDQGWRIEIKKYPKLTSIGAWRKGSQVGAYKQQTFDTLRYGGFYTQEEIKEIVAYAAARYITVVPEIEMPGHALAALAAYPQFSCTGGPFEVARGWGVFDDVYCPKEETFSFLQDVLDEVCALFPGKYIHIGGDECLKARWKNCTNCQALIKKENLKDEHGLQSYFITRVEKYLNSKGKQIIGWDEILEGGLAPNASVMSWRGTAGGIAAAKQKHNVVMSPGNPCYFDHYQSKETDKEPIAIGGYNPLDSVYKYNPTPKELSAEEQKYILGAQGNVWTEYITTFKQVEYMSLPRMCALAEVLWTNPESKNFNEFTNRLQNNLIILDKMGAHYAEHYHKK